MNTFEAVVRAYRELGIRAVVAPLISDLPFTSTVITDGMWARVLVFYLCACVRKCVECVSAVGAEVR